MKIVIVDDTPMSLTMLQYLVRKLPDCEAICFTDPQEGLAWCGANQPDLLIVDFMMPDLDGTTLVARFRERHHDVPVLMVTANHDVALRHEALQKGVTDFLNKPLDNVEFIARARNMLALRKNQKLSYDRISWLDEEVRKATRQIVEQERSTIFCLAKAAEYRDPETGSHILRMAHYSRHIARVLALSNADQELLLEAAPMHDIGKVGTPDAILLKPGRLTPEEFEIMKQHAEIGYKVLSQMRSPLLAAAAQIAYTHHEKFDGSGYPRGLTADEIPIFGRIVAVADVFDALTSARPYKKAWSVESAIQFLIDGKGKHFDPSCVDAFLSDWDEVIAIRERFADDESANETSMALEVHA
ncbi:response regulator [Noviherbaspirillum sp. DKR-6]|uniref:Response regulator n=2 Tax=Noviherbaspirillum pedocola TaxID=2801341 RepID=A0A934W8J5_9BURK|nr:response regulator [Noviherbaspirillum pedocola]